MDVIISKPFVEQYIGIMSRAFAGGFPLPSRDQLIKQNKLIRNLIDANVWTAIRDFYVFANDASTLNYSIINWKLPAGNVLTTNGALTKLSNVGVKGNGSNAYMIAPNSSQLAEDCLFMAREADNVQSGTLDGQVLYGGRAGSGSNLIRCAPRSSSNTFRWTIKQNEANSISGQTDSTGYSTLVGSSSFARAYKNGAMIQSTDGVTGALHFQVYLLADFASDAVTNLSLRTIQLWLTGSNSLESSIGTIETIFNDYLNSL